MRRRIFQVSRILQPAFFPTFIRTDFTRTLTKQGSGPPLSTQWIFIFGEASMVPRCTTHASNAPLARVHGSLKYPLSDIARNPHLKWRRRLCCFVWIHVCVVDSIPSGCCAVVLSIDGCSWYKNWHAVGYLGFCISYWAPHWGIGGGPFTRTFLGSTIV